MKYEIIDEADIDALMDTPGPVEASPPAVHYVDNERLTLEMSEWALEVREAKKNGKEPPVMRRFIAESAMKIASNLATKHCYSGYSWRSEMISDALECIVKYGHSFSLDAPTRSGKPNAFGYISLITTRCFHARIETENRQAYLRNKSFELMGGESAVHEDDYVDLAGGDAAKNAMRDMIDRAGAYEVQMKLRRDNSKKVEKIALTSHTNVLGFIS